MKKLTTVIVLVIGFLTALVSCSVQPQKPDEKEPLSNNKKGYLIDMCSKPNMPRFPYRPKLYPKELKNLTEEQMDARIKKHIDDMDNHIDVLEAVILETRDRVQLCR